MKELRTEIEIQATAEKVWQVLADLANYPEWNPFITRAAGEARVGGKVDITVGSGGGQRVLHCTVVKADPGRELTWKYHVGAAFLFSGEHSMVIEVVGENRVRFVDREVFNGLLVPLQAKAIDGESRSGFEAMDRALKARAEGI
jgi:hypothetical protein